MKAAFQDILYGVRLLRKNPGLTIIAILTLTVGIGVNSAVFSVANTVMFFPFPHVDPDRAVFVSATNPERGVGQSSISLADYLDWQDRATSFDGLAAEDSVPFNITGGEVPVRVVGLVATTNIFDVIGVQPDRGRGFVPEDSIPGANRVVCRHPGLPGPVPGFRSVRDRNADYPGWGCAHRHRHHAAGFPLPPDRRFLGPPGPRPGSRP